MSRTLSLVLLLSLLFTPAGAQLIPRDIIENCPTVSGWNSPNRVQVVAVPEGLRISWIPAAGGPTTISGFEIARAGDLNGPYRIIGLVNGSVNEFIDREAVARGNLLLPPAGGRRP